MPMVMVAGPEEGNAKVKGMYIGYLAGISGMYAQKVLPPAGAILARTFCGPIVITRLPAHELLTVKLP